MLRVNQLIGFGARRLVGGAAPSAHRYWRLLVHMNEAASAFVTIYEVELRETISGADATGSGTASADSTSAGSAAQAFDNNTANGWHSGSGGYPHWLQYDFGAGQEKDINEVAITSRGSIPTEAPRDWSLQYSDDGSNWTTKWSIYGEDGWTATQTRTYSDPGAAALYVYPGITDAHDILGSAMRGWFPSDLVTGSNGDAQQILKDVSGNGFYQKQLTSAQRPTLVTADLNGLNTLRFTASDQEFMNIAHPMLAGSSALSAYLVIKLANDPPVAGDGGLWRIGTDNQNDHFPYVDSNVYSGFGSTARKSAGNPAPSLASWRIVSFHSAASDFRIYIDGTLFYSTSSNTVAIANLPFFGRGPSSNIVLNGWVAEQIYSNANDGTTARQGIEGYTAHKFGLTGNLDVAHPHKSSPP